MKEEIIKELSNFKGKFTTFLLAESYSIFKNSNSNNEKLSALSLMVEIILNANKIDDFN